MQQELQQDIQAFQEVYQLLSEYLVKYSFQLFGALLIMLVGIWLSRKLGNVVLDLLKKQNLDITLANFIANVTRAVLVIMFVIIALGKIGISVTPFVAAIGAASLGAGLALQGMLANYAAGFTIIITRPFVVGNTISVQAAQGLVKEINLGYTILLTEDGEEISVPNKFLVGEVLENSFEYSLVEGCIGISYQDKPELAIEVITKVLADHADVAQSPAHQVGIGEFGDSAINIHFRYWVQTQRIFSTQYQVNSIVFNAIKSAGLTIPFPQREVRLLDK